MTPTGPQRANLLAIDVSFFKVICANTGKVNFFLPLSNIEGTHETTLFADTSQIFAVASPEHVRMFLPSGLHENERIPPV